MTLTTPRLLKAGGAAITLAALLLMIAAISPRLYNPCGPLPNTVPESEVGAAIWQGIALVVLQIVLARRTRRFLNPGLFLATVLAWIFTVFAARQIPNSEEIAPGVAVAVVALTWLGLRPRLKEYGS